MGPRLNGPAGGDEAWPEEDEGQEVTRYGTISTYAAKLGHQKPVLLESTFSRSLARFMTEFLRQN